ncbi:sporulation protein [Nocardiopsis sp. LOL_012]|uniref:sporulation protein n=1 Tax=Nocardiopsis sp. LOL_012 TaxID=3345409 RepID=UPI003A864961
MIFKRMLASVGIGGATVETTLDSENVQPGGTVTGTLKVTGGSVAQTVEGISVGLRATVEKEYTYTDEEGEEQSGEYTIDVVVADQVVSDEEFELEPEQEFELAFELTIPLEAPLTAVNGEILQKGVGVNTRLHVDKALDRTDVDPLAVEPLPVHAAVLEAVAALGFELKSVDLEKGKIAGTRQKLPFYQEFEYGAAGQYEGLNSLELTFFTDEDGVDIVLELDKKPGILFSEGGDTLLRLTIDHESLDAEEIAGRLHEWIDAVAGERSLF